MAARDEDQAAHEQTSADAEHQSAGEGPGNDASQKGAE
jgi:hypothetical protein